MKSAIKILYIVGYGRSGSTVLEGVLASLPETVGIGQFRTLPVVSVEHPQMVCTCGDRIVDCSFWGKFLSECAQQVAWLKEHHNDDPYHTVGKKFKEFFDSLIFRVSGRLPTVASDDHDRQSAFMQAIIDNAGQEVIIDSSKKPMRLLALMSNPAFDVRVIHLVRDGRSVIESKRKEKSSRPTPALLTMISWAYHNLLAHWIYRRTPDSKRIRVNYETFAAQPQSEFRRICEQFGLQTEKAIDTADHYDPASIHAVAGNTVRLGGRRPIKPQGSNPRLGLMDKIVYMLIGRPVARLMRP